MADRITKTVSADQSERIEQQLNRILASKVFRQADRLQRFLRFIVEETIAGREDRLKEFLVGIEVFDKEASFDPRTDPIVRVQARRLRTRLARYYREEGHNDEILIELPKGGYAPVFQRIESSGLKRTMTAALVSRNTIVVLPFADYSSAGDQDYFCRGLTQEVSHTLAQTGNIRVVERSAVLHSDGSNDPQAAGIIISGSVRKDGGRLRITTCLIDAPSGCYLWSRSFDRKTRNIFGIQEEVAQAILTQLQAELVQAGNARRTRRPTENLAAHNLYLQGRYHLEQRTEEGLLKAVEFFEKAIVEDPQYAHAFSGLADACTLLAHYGVLAPVEVWNKAASNAAWAVLLDEDLAEAHTSLAHVKSAQDWDWHGGEREFQRAISLNPRYPTAHHWYAMTCLAPLSRLDDALDQMRLAQALDPISSIISRDVAMTYYYKRDFETALEQCDHSIEQNPYFSAAYWILGLVQEQRGDFDESVAAFERAVQLSPNSPRMRGALGRTLALSGKHDHARRILDELQDLAKKRYVSPFELASIHFALDEGDAGYEWLTKAYQDRCFELVSIKVDPRFDALRGEAQFVSLSRQLGLP